MELLFVTALPPLPVTKTTNSPCKYITTLHTAIHINTAIMVHLSTVPKDSNINQPLVKGIEKLNMSVNAHADTFTTTVYGSRFATEDLPKHEMPECEMPKEVACRIIRDHLSLDGNPMLK
jgi:glutamate decarboxylase